MAIRRAYTYAIPAELEDLVVPGIRVEVQFAKSRHYAAIVLRIHENKPTTHEPKELLCVLDETPLLHERHLDFWEWIADYYCCGIGEVMIAALPAGFKLASETKLSLSPFFDKDDESLTDTERLITNAMLIQLEITVEDIQKILNRKTVMPLIQSLLAKRLIYLQEELKEKYTPKTAKFVRFAEPYRSQPDTLKDAFDLLDKRAERQAETLMALIMLLKNEHRILLKTVVETAKCTHDVVKKLSERGIVEIQTLEVSRLNEYNDDSETVLKLSDEQTEVFKQIKKLHKEKQTVLLQGVTGSGKTEVYIKLIQDTIEAGKQALFLVPEIALTAQLVQRLRKHFAGQIVVYHSKFNDKERVEIWKSVQAGKEVILGARSSIFLPFRDLGLIITDEEHDSSYKQQDPAPRYNARDAANFIAAQYNAKVVLGTATPSLETWFNVMHGKYAHVKLTQRYGGIEMPELLIADVRDALRRKQMSKHFTPLLMTEMQKTLENKEQIILFQNRRGYAPIMKCSVCEWTAGCNNCDVSLTYHQHTRNLSCHYCGYEIPPPNLCPACGARELRMAGFGTEKIEEDLKIYFPDARVERMDLDTVKGKHDHDKLIERFENHEIDVLVGTQMVTKGLDFEKVSLVGVLSADQLLKYPDFRAAERAFQLLTQVSGRAGRKHKRGRVVIQAFDTTHPIIEDVLKDDFPTFMQRELSERKSFYYPPFYRIISIRLKHKAEQTLNKAAELFEKRLKEVLGTRVLGPAQPAVARVREYHLLDFMIKLEKNPTIIEAAKKCIDDAITELSSTSGLTSVRVGVDVDAY